ncbi:MAG: Aspartate/alanine antiporter [Chloroflexi bacterium ADurb.Bin325]|nr:MAG: Aspartate/alanine antiporter [Chloroflexi bacterium ADurb.Bin325]
MSALLTDQMLVLFAILALGSWLGHLSFRGVSLGTAAVFFVGLAFGHFGLTVPKPIMDLGLLLFLYAVGLQAGPRFFRTFRKQGIQFVVIAGIAIGAAAVVTAGLAWVFRLPFALAAGMFTGALTNTPALAGALDAISRIAPDQAATVSVGYGIAYPFSVVGVTLLTQFLPRLLRRDVKAAEEQWLAAQLAEQPALQKAQFRVSNPNLDGKRLDELDTHRLSQVNISRVRKGQQVILGTPDVTLHLGDVVLVVGAPDELAKMRLFIGEEVDVPMEAGSRVVSRDLYVSEASLVGKRLMDLRVWDRHNIIITRIRRQGLEITPVGTSMLDLGDTLRVVGDEQAIAQFARLVSGNTRRIEETDMVPFLIGLVLGVGLGLAPFQLPNGLTIKLGAAGGAFLVSLVLGHFGRIGPFRLYVPAAARNLSRELGLMLFLGGAGANAGTQLFAVIRQQGGDVFAIAAVITLTAVVLTLLLTHVIYKMNLLSTLGLLAGVMTNPPALATAGNQTSTDVPAVTYASAFPVVLIFKILLAQLLVQVLHLF